MPQNRTLVLLFLIGLFSSGYSLNLLGIFPHHGKSHFDVFEPLLKALAAKGHNVTVISHFPQKTLLPRYHDISIQGEADILVDAISLEDLPKTRLIQYFTPLLLTEMARDTCNTLHSKPIQDFLKRDYKFDLILTEAFNSDCYLGFIHKYKVPFISLSSCTLMIWTNTRFGNPMNPSYIPNSFFLFSDRMNFIERVENTLAWFYSELLYKYLVIEPGYIEAKKVFGDDLPPLTELAKNVSLMLINTYFNLNLPRPLVPSIVEVGGMFLGKNKPLPQNIEKYLNDSQHGVVYFSMGSMIKTHTFSNDTRKAFLNSFAKLEQRFLWKWENDSIPDKPDNLMIQKWMPQYDILCHPNVVAFISHGGLLGTTEAIYCGVPMIVMPQYGDQFTNAKAIEAIGLGVIMNLNEATEETIDKALKTVLEPSFRKKVKEISDIYRDRPMSPMDTAIYWVEYVARHGGAKHMRTAAVDMPLYQYLLLDVVAFLLVILAIILALAYYSLRFLLRLIFGKKKEKVKTN